MQIDLNIFRIKLVLDLQHKSVGIHTLNIVYINTIAAHYKDTVFLCDNVYMLISKIQLSASHVILTNQIILFIFLYKFLTGLRVPTACS